MGDPGETLAGYWRIGLEYWHISLVGALLVAISLGFVIKFVIPAFRLSSELKRALTALREIRTDNAGGPRDLEEIKKRAMASPAL